MREADKVRETYRDDPTVSNEEYGRMVEDADRADEAREWEAEAPERDADYWAEFTWENEHEAGCPIIEQRADLLRALVLAPDNPYLRGAVPEYDGGGDQEADGCTCTPRGWVVYQREPGDAGERIVGYTVSPFASVFEWARDAGEDPADLRVELVPEPEPAPTWPDEDPGELIIAKLEALAYETKANCFAYLTREWSGGIEADPFPPLAILEAIYEAHEDELWGAAGSDEHEAYDADMASVQAYEVAIAAIREVFGLAGPEREGEA